MKKSKKSKTGRKGADSLLNTTVSRQKSGVVLFRIRATQQIMTLLSLNMKMTIDMCGIQIFRVT